MNKLMMAHALVAVGIASFACGCYSPKVVYNNYPTTAFAEVALKNNATMKIVTAADDTNSSSLVASLKDAFGKTKQFTVTDEKADYWMIIDGLADSRTDTPEVLPFTEKQEVATIGSPDDKPGPAHEELVTKKQASHTLAKGVSVAIYEANTLTPVHYFEIPVYDGAIKVAGGEKVASKKEIEKELFDQIVGRVKDVFITQVKNIKTPVPDEASAEMKKAIADKDAAKAVVAASQKNCSQKFSEFLKDVQAGKYEDKKDELTLKLSDYYVLAIAREIGCLDAKVLKELHAQQVGILQFATTDSLALACPVALARLEYKLANLDVK